LLPGPGALILQETGGTFDTNNLATGTGATAFAKDVSSFGGVHQISELNDGVFGNSNSWIGGSDPSFAGINLNGSFSIQSVAWGRDNNNNPPYPAPANPPYGDRNRGIYTLQYTTVSSPNELTSDTGNATTGWLTIDSITYAANSPQNADRHRYSFPAVTATGIRLITDPTSPTTVSASDFIDIDELEVYSTVPEPAGVGLMGLVAGLGLLQRRRRAGC
jgi:hypothetical protein